MSTLLLSSGDVAELLDLDSCIAAVELAFRMHGEGSALPPGILGFHLAGGGFHIKAGTLDLKRSYFATKINGNFPGNRVANGLPNIQGVVVLCDAGDGQVLAVVDSIQITILRTGAATAVAARVLALPQAATLAVCGCGNQGRVQAEAISRVRKLQRVFAFDAEPQRADQYAAEMSPRLGVQVEVVKDLAAATRQSAMVVTCTPAHGPLLRRGDLAPGAFLAAVGADNPEKQELDPDLVASSAVVADVLEQCATIGELHHAIAAGRMTRDQARGELSEVLVGRKPGRLSDSEVVIFDSTGMALQDVAAAAAVYERALHAGRGARFAFALP